MSESDIIKSSVENTFLYGEKLPCILLIIIFFESILIMIITVGIYCEIPNPPLVFLPTNIFQTQLVGVIVGSLLTLISSYFLFSLKHLHELKSIARGFCSELAFYQDWTQYFIDTYSTRVYNKEEVSPIPELNRPIFDTDSLYYTLRKEIFNFNEETVAKLLQFYSCLKAAEEDRRRLLHIWEHEDLAANFHRIFDTQVHMMESLQKANNLNPEITTELKLIIDKKI